MINEKEDKTYQYIWAVAETVVRMKYRVLNAYIKKKRTQINNLTFHHKTLEKEDEIKHK